MVTVRLHYCDQVSFERPVVIEQPRTIVWEGEITGIGSDSMLCEEVWEQFNRGSGQEHPALDRLELRSLSVGDVIEIVRPGNGAWFLCDSFGWKPIEGCRSRS